MTRIVNAVTADGRNIDLDIEGKLIRSVQDHSSMPDPVSDTETFDASAYVILPPFVDAHTSLILA